MAALTATLPTHDGVAIEPGSVAATDTIAVAQLGSKGAILEVTNGNASPDVMSISDHGRTPGGSALTGNAYAATVTNGTSKRFLIHPRQANPATGLVTITHSVTTTVTYRLTRIP